MSNTKNKQQNKEFDLDQERLRTAENEKNHKSAKIESVEANSSEKNLKPKDKIYKNVHSEPADEQQFENNTLHSDNTKL
jgi:hypothetical protein